MNEGISKKGKPWFLIVLGGTMTVNKAKKTAVLVPMKEFWLTKEQYAKCFVGLMVTIKGEE